MTAQHRFVLGPNQYGKAEVHVVKITRDSERHQIEDLCVTSELKGDFESAYLDGNNEHIVPTDTQKNTVFGMAREGIGSPEAFLLRVGQHFTDTFDWVSGGRWEAEQTAWDRISLQGTPHEHAFVKNGQATRTAVLVRDPQGDHVFGGLTGLTVLKSTASGFAGYPKDAYTTLEETTDRVLSTDVTARWRFNTRDVDFNAVYASVKALFLEGFAERYSDGLQQTLYDMGTKALAAHPEIDEIRFSMPNKHHFVVDLSPFGQDNPNEVFFAADRPYGLIEAAVARDDATPADNAWRDMAGLC